MVESAKPTYFLKKLIIVEITLIGSMKMTNFRPGSKRLNNKTKDRVLSTKDQGEHLIPENNKTGVNQRLFEEFHPGVRGFDHIVKAMCFNNQKHMSAITPILTSLSIQPANCAFHIGTGLSPLRNIRIKPTE